MFNRLVDFFVDSKLEKISYERYLGVLFVRTIFVFSLVLNMGWLLHLTGVFYNKAPYLIINIIFISGLLIYKYTGKLSLAASIVAIYLFIAIVQVIDYSGGIYSYNLRWLMFVIFFSFLFNNTNKTRYPFLFIALSAATIVYYYIIDINGTHDFLKDKLEFSNLDYMIDNLSFILVISGLAYFYYRSQKKVTDLVTDKTEKLAKTSRRLKDSNRSLESYAYATSHDMKQPVRTIVSFTQLLEKEIGTDNLSGDAREYMDFIKTGTQRISELIDGVLDYSTINNYDQNQFKAFKVENVLNDIVKDLAKQIKDSNVKITYEDLPIITAFEIHIKRVFQNIISNAIKFKAKERDLVINIESKENETHYIFSISDNGIGIPEDRLDYIFEPFKRLDFKEKGSGIGLATCKKIVLFHNGEIWAESKKGVGSCFKFTVEKITI